MKVFSAFHIACTAALAFLILYHPAAKPRPLDAHATTVRLDIGTQGVCSGTIVGPHAVLTATHCLATGAPISIDGKPVFISDQIDDGADHSIIVTDRTFDHCAQRGAMPSAGAPVTVYGNPDGKRDWLQRGFVVGVDQNPDDKPVIVLDVNGFFGDSGAGVFDENGRLVGVIDIIDFDTYQGVQYKMMGAYPLAFTPEQWAQGAV